ncbi:MAG: hypothetical protein U0R76_18290 [Candidatus Nanopelagicales bacterium]
MHDVAPEPPYPRWTEADSVELMLLLKKLPDGPRGVLRAAVDGKPAPADAVGSVRTLDTMCDAFYRAPLVVLDGAALRLDVDDRAWVRAVLDR